MTWYGKNGSTDFLSEKTSILIQGNNKNCTVYFSKIKRGGKNIFCLHCAGDVVPYPHQMSQPKSWYGVALSPFTTLPFEIIPESFYAVSDGLCSFELPETWPAPDTSSFFTDNALIFKRISSNDTECGIYRCEWEGITIVVIKNDCSEKTYRDLSSFNEKIDLLIITSENISSVNRYREQIRPLYTVGVCGSDSIPQSYQNLFLFSTDQTEVLHFKHKKNHLLQFTSQTNTR